MQGYHAAPANATLLFNRPSQPSHFTTLTQHRTMARITPLLPLHTAAGAVLLPYGPTESQVHLVESFAPFGLEYASLRTAAAMFDAPSRGLIRVTGTDAHAFLQRMVTGDLRGLDARATRRAFWLNRKGRIDADLLIAQLPPAAAAPFGPGPGILLELDAHSAQHTVDTLNAFIIADDVALEDLTDATHQLQLHGPAAVALLAAHSHPLDGPPVAELPDGGATIVAITTGIGLIPTLVFRQDLTGDPGLSMICAAAAAPAVYEALSDLPQSPTQEGGAFATRQATPDRPARRIGWHAFNVARIEAGTPLFNLDYGPTNLPHETGDEVVKSRVSFTKGCYLGQEVVARMHALGHAKQRLLALDLETATAAASQPVTGSLVFSAADDSQPPVGAVTSSAISPMLGGRTVCFAMVKYAHSAAETALYVQPNADTLPLPAKVRKNLRFWSRPDSISTPRATSAP